MKLEKETLFAAWWIKETYQADLLLPFPQRDLKPLLFKLIVFKPVMGYKMIHTRSISFAEAKYRCSTIYSSVSLAMPHFLCREVGTM